MSLVSVVMPVYNQERYVEAAVRSVLAQTFKDFEFIILDNGSTDGTSEILDGFDDPRIRIFPLEQKGLVPALEYGIKKSNGKWIARMDSDDIAHPDRLRQQLGFFEQHPDCLFVGSVYGIVTPNNKYLLPRADFGWRYMKPRDITLKREMFADPSVMFDREQALAVGLYDPDFENEKPLYYRLLTHGRGAVMSAPLHFIRWRIGSLSRSNFKKWSTVNRDVRLRYDPEDADLGRIYNLRSAKNTEVRAALLCVYFYLLAHDYSAARETAFDTLRSHPFQPKVVKLVGKALLGLPTFKVWSPPDASFFRANPMCVFGGPGLFTPSAETSVGTGLS